MSQVLERVESKIKSYQTDHRGAKPLFILLSADEAEKLSEAVRKSKGYDEKVPVTEFNGAKIVSDPARKEGDILLTNELPGD